MKNKLLCTFTTKKRIEKTIFQIEEKYENNILNNKIIVIKNTEKDSNEIYCIYNVNENINNVYLPNTILIHRKRGYNTLYTINSLNDLIWLLNNGKKDVNFEVPWENYKNTFLLNKDNKFFQIKTELVKIIKI